MKLYTEEQVIELTKASFTAGRNHNSFIFWEELKNITPIELPSDEEIHKSSPHQIGDSNNSWDIGFHNGWKQGAKWMRDKIKGGDK